MKVKCKICGKVMTTTAALKHVNETKHNKWELIKEVRDGIS